MNARLSNRDTSVQNEITRKWVRPLITVTLLTDKTGPTRLLFSA